MSENVDREQGMPEKGLMYDSSVLDYEVDENGNPDEVTLVERWGKSRRRRARTRVLPREKLEFVPGGGYVAGCRGVVVENDTVYEIIEISDRSRWWLRPVKWGDDE